jgi:hypothetical protein
MGPRTNSKSLEMRISKGNENMSTDSFVFRGRELVLSLLSVSWLSIQLPVE